jgi:hypothetical protein
VATERWERLATTGAIAFVALIVVAVLLPAEPPGSDARLDEWASYYDDSGNRSKSLVSAFLVFVAGALFLFWLGALRSVVARLEPRAAVLGTLAVYGGLVGLVLQLAGTAAGAAYPAAVDFFDDFGADGRLAMALAAVSFWVTTMANVGGVVMAGALAAIVLGTALYPRWFGWISALVAVTQLAGAVIPFLGLLFLPWVLLLAILMLRRPATVRGAPAGTP